MKLIKKVFLLILVVAAAILILPTLFAYDGNIESPALPIFIDTNYSWVWNFFDTDYNSELDYVYSIGYNTAQSFDGSESYFINNILDNNITDRNEGLLQWLFDPREPTQLGDRAGDSNRPVQEGKSYNFDGNNDYINIPDNTNLDFGTTDFSVSFWVKYNIDGYAGLVSKGVGALDGGWEIVVNNANGKIRSRIEETGGAEVSYESPLEYNDNEWHNVITTYDRDENLSLYIDNVYIGGIDISSVGDITTAYDLKLGVQTNDSNYYTGEMFDTRIYNKTLDINEIQQVYNHESVAVVNLVVQYKMDEDSGTTAYDSSGNENHGTIENTNGFNQDTTPELVSNGNFTNWTTDDPDDWTVINETANSTISQEENKMRFIYDSADAIQFYVNQNIGITSGKKYKVIIKIDEITGTLKLRLSSDSVVKLINTTRIHTYEMIADGSIIALWRYQVGVSVNALIDNISVTEIPFFNTQPVFSWQNQTGYSKDGNVFIPRDESDTTKDVLGSDLNYTGRVKYDVELKGSTTMTVWDDSTIVFPNSIDWNYMTYEGTAVADLNIDTNSITFLDQNGEKIIYNIKIYDSTDTLLTWLPVSEGTGNTLYDITGTGYNAMLNSYEYINDDDGNMYVQVMEFTDNAADTSSLKLNDTGDFAVVDWTGDSDFQEISTSSETTSTVTPSTVKIFAKNSNLTYFYSTNNNFSFDIANLPTNLTSYYNSGSNTTSGDIANLPTSLTSYRNYGSNTTSGDIANLPINLTYYHNYGSNTTSGDIANLPTNLTYYINTGSNTTSGDIANLPTSLIYYYNYGSNITSGDIANLPTSLTSYCNYGSNTTSGDIANLPINLTYYRNSGSNTTSGDIANLPTNLTYYRNSGLNQVNTYTSGHTFSASIIYFLNLPAVGYGLDSTEVDNLLIDLESSGMSSGIINLSGNNAAPGSSGEAAIDALRLNGVSVTVTGGY